MNILLDCTNLKWAKSSVFQRRAWRLLSRLAIPLLPSPQKMASSSSSSCHIPLSSVLDATCITSPTYTASLCVIPPRQPVDRPSLERDVALESSIELDLFQAISLSIKLVVACTTQRLADMLRVFRLLTDSLAMLLYELYVAICIHFTARPAT